MSVARGWIVAALVLALLAFVLIAGLAPYVYAEYEFTLRGHGEPLGPQRVQPVAGRWFSRLIDECASRSRVANGS
jgi:hypothetical protein